MANPRMAYCSIPQTIDPESFDDVHVVAYSIMYDMVVRVERCVSCK